MNKKGQALFEYALVFVVLFFLGGVIGYFSLPEFPGRFYVSGLIFSIFATGAGKLILNIFAGGR